MKTLLNYLFPAFCLVICTCWSSCREEECKCESPTTPPYLVVLGEDLSGTFQGYVPLSVSDLKSICKSVSKSGCGGRVALIVIGNPSKQGFALCDLLPLPKIDRSATVGQRAKCKRSVSVNIKKNNEAIEIFLSKCEALIAETGQQQTDINGFFDKATQLMNDPEAEQYEKWLYANSDGQQDTPGVKSLDCSRKPEAQFFVSGWAKAKTCSADGSFLSPALFTQYLKKQILSANESVEKH